MFGAKCQAARRAATRPGGNRWIRRQGSGARQAQRMRPVRGAPGFINVLVNNRAYPGTKAALPFATFCNIPAVFRALFPNATKLPQIVADMFTKLIPKGVFMTVTETMAVTLLVTGGISLYILVQAAIDVLRHGNRHNGDQ
jgi:hypothetical protein